MRFRTMVAVAMVVLPRIAGAQDADAEALFAEGERLEGKGLVNEACEAFAASNRIESRAGTMIRLAQCREAQGRLATAWSVYKDALTRAKDPAKQRLAEARIAALEPRLSYLTVLVPDGSRVDGLALARNSRGLDPGLWNRAVPVDGGRYTIAGRAPGHETWFTTIEVANEGANASVEVPRFRELKALIDGEGDGDGEGGEEGHGRRQGQGHGEGGERDGDGAGMSGQRKMAIGLGAGGVVALGGALVLGLQARGLEDSAYDVCPDPAAPCARAGEAESAFASARGRALGANVAGVIGAAALGGAAFLWFTGAPGAASSRTAWRPALRPGLAGFDVTVRF